MYTNTHRSCPSQLMLPVMYFTERGCGLSEQKYSARPPQSTWINKSCLLRVQRILLHSLLLHCHFPVSTEKKNNSTYTHTLSILHHAAIQGASRFALGAVGRCARDKAVRHPVLYFTRAMNKKQSQAMADRDELQAVTPLPSLPPSLHSNPPRFMPILLLPYFLYPSYLV